MMNFFRSINEHNERVEAERFRLAQQARGGNVMGRQ